MENNTENKILGLFVAIIAMLLGIALNAYIVYLVWPYVINGIFSESVRSYFNPQIGFWNAYFLILFAHCIFTRSKYSTNTK